MKKTCSLLISMLVLTGCSSDYSEYSLTKDVAKSDIAPIVLEGNAEYDSTDEIIDFSLDVFSELYNDESTLISPVSIVSALSMTANGANGETLEQMEEVLGVDAETMNEFLYAYTEALPTSEKYKVDISNSIWFNDSENLQIQDSFLQTNVDCYSADIFKLPFDNKTKKHVNSWVNEKTDGQIDNLIENAPSPEAVMYLINALTFDAEWEFEYYESQVFENIFTNSKGEEKTTEYMFDTLFSYIELPNATGFPKGYADDSYSFVALLPNEGVELGEFINSLDSEAITEAINNQQEVETRTTIPKFSMEYSTELSSVLTALGMKDAFNDKIADFNLLGQAEENIYISEVLHKTMIEVNEKGTKAGAVAEAAMAASEAEEEKVEPKEVFLNRPFFYMIVDNNLGVPIFMGTLNDVE